jgi:AsnC-type helix-turn-helix domain
LTRTLDHIDRRLIAELQADGRKPYGRIASELEVSESVVRYRAQRLEDDEPRAWGPTDNLVAPGNDLRERGIRVVFVVLEFIRETAPEFRKPTIEQLVRSGAAVPAA